MRRRGEDRATTFAYVIKYLLVSATLLLLSFAVECSESGGERDSLSSQRAKRRGEEVRNGFTNGRKLEMIYPLRSVLSFCCRLSLLLLLARKVSSFSSLPFLRRVVKLTHRKIVFSLISQEITMM